MLKGVEHIEFDEDGIARVTSRCARCDGMLGRHRAASCWFDEALGELRFEPGDDVLRHRCPPSKSVN